MIESWLQHAAALSADITLASGAAILLGLSCVYLALLAVYRLWLSPLSQYPGPKLAALTQWVETYHELRGDGGQFIFKVDEWHEKYGPIVRISPHEVHIRDADFYEAFYANTHVADRRAALSHRFGIPLASHFTSDHATHRRRRAAMNPIFSKRKAAAYGGPIQAVMDRVCTIIEATHSGTGTPLDTNAMWGCVASDVVAGYALGISFGFIESKGFDSSFVKGMFSLLEPLHVVTQFPLVGKLMMALPDWVSLKMQPSMEPVLRFKSKVTEQVRTLKAAAEQPSDDSKADLPETLTTVILQSDLPPSDLTLERLRQESIGIVGAGVETVYRAMTVGTYYLLAEDAVRLPLEAELKAAIPDPSQIPSYEKLLQLPYLSACVKEIQRVGIGTSQRSPRIFRRTTPQYAVHPLVLNEAFSMSIRDVHFDPAVFPSPDEFLPSRWLPADFTPDGKPVDRPFQARAPSGKLLSRYLNPYARGARNCVGMHVADAEIYIGLATMFRRFAGRMRLAQGVGRETVGVYMDRFVPRERPGAGKVLVMIDGDNASS